MKILFVDDEPLILEGLRNLLRRFRKKWSMSFATGGEEALKTLDTESFDIIVTDMRMPGISGAELLTRVRDSHPGTARIMLSGYSEEKTILQALPVAHQYMSKPCDPVVLQRIIENLVTGAGSLDDEQIATAANRLGAPMTPPEILTELSALLENADENSEAIHRLIAADIGLTARLLQVVSSSFFGRPQVVSEVRQAIQYLGFPMLKRLVNHGDIFNPTLPADAELAQEMARVKVATDSFTNHLAVLLDENSDGGPATTAGRLIGLGALAMVQMGYQTDGPSQNANRVTQFLLRLWGLPQNLVCLPTWLDNQPDGSTLDVPQAIFASRNAWRYQNSTDRALDIDFLKSLGLGARVDTWNAQIQSRNNRGNL